MTHEQMLHEMEQMPDDMPLGQAGILVSIKKWENLDALTAMQNGHNPDAANCALCLAYSSDAVLSVGEDECVGCPLEHDADEGFCGDGSHYSRACAALEKMANGDWQRRVCGAAGETCSVEHHNRHVYHYEYEQARAGLIRLMLNGITSLTHRRIPMLENGPHREASPISIPR